MIGRITVTLEPMAYASSERDEYYRLRVKVEPASGRADILGDEITMRLSDFQSRFDFIFDRAKERIEAHIKEAWKAAK